MADAKRVQRGSPPFVERAYSAIRRVAAPPVDSAVITEKHANLKIAYAAQAQKLAAYEAANVVKLKILDPGSSVSVLADVTRADSKTIQLCCMAEICH